MENIRKLFYQLTGRGFKIQCFKLLDKDEFSEPAYEVVATNIDSKETDSVFAYQPQAAIALADTVMATLNN